MSPIDPSETVTLLQRSHSAWLKQPFGLLEFLLAGAGTPIAGIMREADATRPDKQPLTNPVGPRRQIVGVLARS